MLLPNLNFQRFFRPSTGRRRPGFTVIELMVVVVLIGIFAALAVPDYRQHQQREALRTSVIETKAYLDEAFAQARALSQNQNLYTRSDTELEFCGIFIDGTEICERPLELPNGITLTLETAPGVPTTVSEWSYTAPHGDINGLTIPIELVFTHDSGEARRLRIYPQSGLIEEIFVTPPTP